jgi:hypothetical protein
LEQKSCAQPAHGTVTSGSHLASDAVFVHTGSELGGRCTPGHKAEALGATLVLNQKAIQGAFPSPGGSIGLPGALPGCARISAGASAHSPAPPDGNRVQVPCFKKTLLPTNFVEVLRLFGW